MTVALIAAAFALQPGTYALNVEMVTETKVPVLGDTRVHTRSAAVVQLSVDGGQWSQSQRTCAVDVWSRGPARTIMPPALLASLPVQRFEIDVDGERYVADGGPVTIGASATGPLPVDLADARALDTDGDGHPGATMWLDVPVLGRVELFVAQRAHSVFEGVLDGDGGVSGGVRVVSMEQQTLGASRSMFHTSPAMRAVPEASRFELRPLPPGAGCDAIPPFVVPPV
jgi:hypothetical protein